MNSTVELDSAVQGSATVIGEGQKRPMARAAAWLAFLGPFFFLSYGFANWWTSRLPAVESLVFEWERHIPFLEWTIWPYMSIDAFYALSLFLCTSRAELDTHARRLLAATVISVIGFLCFPLQFSFARPETSGWNGMLFATLAGFDKPFNQAPSLHISLLLILWLVYARHCRGLVRAFMHVWFALIGISVFTTYQHHVVDGVSGLAVGMLCVYLFPAPPVRWCRPDLAFYHPRLAAWYGAGGVFGLMLAAWLGGWAWLLAWPALSMLIVCSAYLGLGPAVFQKYNGDVAWVASLLLAPYRLGAWLSSRWLTRRDPVAAECVPGIWIGRAPGSRDWQAMQVASVLDLAAEFAASPQALIHRYASVPMLDLVVPSQEQLAAAVKALNSVRSQSGVLIHCALGYSRSAIVLAAWLLQQKVVPDVDAAVKLIGKARPQTVLSNEHIQALRRFHVEFCAA